MSQRGITSVCVLTPKGRGAVAVIAVEGEEAVSAVDRFFQAANAHALGDQPTGRIVYGHWGGREGEDLIVCRRTDKSLEIHCHGGQQSSAQIVADLSDAGCTEIEAKQWLMRRHACPLAAAAHTALAQTTTYRTATILLTQYHGALRREIGAAVADLEAGNTAEAISRLEGLVQRSQFGLHLTEPWRVVIAGQPNVGKSSLINALVGFERAIVFDQPGTTRDVVSSTTAIEGWPVELSDTAGLHELSPANKKNAIESAGIELARQRLDSADLVVWVLDATLFASQAESLVWDLANQQAKTLGVQLDREQTQIVLNKIDLANELVIAKNPQGVETSAVNGTGIEKLLAAIAKRLVPIVPPPEAPRPFTTEQVATLQSALAECSREGHEAATDLLNRMLNSVSVVPN